ncbi:MAG: aminoacetone oxidase family FAD-binding enzyme [Victivallaceae bacterium]|nr:aminoacetone oxidase family FAD-binding enzyme [Victivallaceae bacterium]
MKHIIVLGAGPAGLSAAIAAATDRKNPCRVTVLEYLPSPGRKLLASGSGKCNITNCLSAEEMAARFPSGQERFVRPSLSAFPPHKLLEFFEERGVRFKLDAAQFHYFPQSERASDLLDALLLYAGSLPIRLCCGVRVQALPLEGKQIVGVQTADGLIRCDGVVVAAGSPAAPSLGGHGSIYPLLEAVGHSIVPPVPALVGLQCVPESEIWSGKLSGMVLERAALSLDARKVTRGEVLFTHTGISGPAVLDLSGRVARILAQGEGPVTLHLHLDRAVSAQEWRTRLETLRRNAGKSSVSAMLRTTFSRAFSDHLSLVAGANSCSCATLSGGVRERLIELLTSMPLEIPATESWQRAMAASGGVSRSEINRCTLRSLVVENLAFAGEVIDVDGPCGGYNIQWAFSSGKAAGLGLAGGVA